MENQKINIDFEQTQETTITLSPIVKKVNIDMIDQELIINSDLVSYKIKLIIEKNFDTGENYYLIVGFDDLFEKEKISK